MIARRLLRCGPVGRIVPAIVVALAVTTASSSVWATRFRHPLGRCHIGCSVVTAYFDLNAASGAVRDWNCGTNTYDGHRGTDIAIYGRFEAQDAGRDIVAAADGQVIAAHDGEFDRCTSGMCSGGGGFGNYVAIRHADGKVTYYAHMRRGSVRVSVGDRVTCGQVIGQVGSSGYSTGPHCHFEVRVGGTADDPFAARAGCGGTESYWVSQGEYNRLPSEMCESSPPPPPPPMDNADIVSQDPPSPTTRRPGERFMQRWTVRNTGTTTWTSGANYLFTHNSGERFGAPLQILLPAGRSVAPGETVDFSTELTAPAAPGRYSGTWRMDRFGTARFGEISTVTINVESPPPPPPMDAGSLPEGGIDAFADSTATDGPTDIGRDAAVDAQREGSTDGGRYGPVIGGCGCHTGGHGWNSSGPVALLVAGIAFAVRRRSVRAERSEK